MGHLGFSWVGAAFLVALFVPNLIWARLPRPAGYDPRRESRVLLVFERVGQAATAGAAVAFDDTDPHAWGLWSGWLVAAVALLGAYEACWVQYFRSRRTLADFTRSLAGVPAPLATLPVAAFALLGVYGRLPVLVASVVVLGIGHIGIHLAHRTAARRDPGGPAGA